MMHKNQYLIADSSFEIKQAPTLSWGDFNVFLGKDTRKAHKQLKSSVLIIGTLVDYRAKENSIENICDEIACLDSKIDIIEFNNHLTGRYVLFFETKEGIYALADACSLKRVLFAKINGHVIITSSEQYYYDLSGDTAKIESETRKTLNEDTYKKKESPWFGVTSIDRRFNFVLGNHILDIKELQANRIPPPKIKQHSSDDEIIKYSANILQSTVDALAMQYSIAVPVTAGYDSRVLLAASFKHKNKVKYYVFGDPNQAVDDITIPKQLAKSFDFELDIVNPEELSNDFAEQFKSTTLEARVLPKTRNIQYHFNHTDSSTININGNCAEIFRSAYGQTSNSITAKNLAFLSGIKDNPELSNNIQTWYDLSIEYANNEDISIADLFYWEQRMSLWGSRFPLEQDIAIEEISPFNNRYLIFNMLATDKKLQQGPDFLSIRKLIENIDADFLEIPINPSTKNKFSLSKWKNLLHIKILNFFEKFLPAKKA